MKMGKSSLMIALFILVILYLGALNFKLVGREKFTTSPGDYPLNVVTPLLFDSYQLTGNKYVNANSYSDIWKSYPIFTEGSYEQITNNLRYRVNPDDGQCIPPEFCDAMYKNNNLKINDNDVYPLQPVPYEEGVRIGYFRTKDNLFMGPQPGKILQLPAF